MRVLFIHQNFPAQFRHVAQALAQRHGVEVIALTDSSNKQNLAAVKTGRYAGPKPPPEGLTRAASTLVNRFQRAEAVAVGLIELRRRGFTPDVVVGHPGWGELMLVKEIFPATAMISHAEFYYTAEGGDVGFDPEFPDVTDGLRITLKSKNVPMLTALLDSDISVAPTAWQASRFPAEFRPKIETIHEGIRTDVVRPNPQAQFSRGTGERTFRPGDEVITFVNRNLEPIRGVHIFMRALPAILAARPEAHAIIVGGEGVSYGAAAPQGETWKARFLAEVQDRLPMERVHFVGNIPYADFVALMQVSRLHVYATYPFVLSWSMLEAMSAGALVLGSATPPVTEMIEHGKNGLLYEFFDVEGLAASAIEALTYSDRSAGLREAARRTIVDRYDLATRCLPDWLALIDRAGSAKPVPQTRPRRTT